MVAINQRDFIVNRTLIDKLTHTYSCLQDNWARLRRLSTRQQSQKSGFYGEFDSFFTDRRLFYVCLWVLGRMKVLEDLKNLNIPKKADNVKETPQKAFIL